MQCALAQLRIRAAPGDLVHHINASVASRELPYRCPGKHRRVHLYPLFARIENAGTEETERVCEPFEIAWIRSGNEVRIVRGAHMPMGLHRQPADQDVLDPLFVQGAKDSLRIERRVSLGHVPPARLPRGDPPYGSKRSPTRVAPTASVPP